MTSPGVEQRDSGPPASVAPAVPPAPARRISFVGRCAAALRVLVRRPGRTAAVLALTAVIAVAVWMIGVQLWGHFLLQAARCDVDHYHNRPAHDHLEAYLRAWPNEPTALLLAARTARRLGTFAEAEKFLDRYEAVRGTDDEALILERVLLQAQRGRVDQVREFCDARVRQNHPTAPLILEAQAAGLIRVYRLDEALERVDAWLKLRPDDCQALLLRAVAATLRNGDDPAAQDLRRVLELDPDNEEAHRRLAVLLMGRHDPTEAFPHLQYLHKAVPDDPRVQVQMAECRVDMAQPDEARKLLDGVLARWPHFPEALAARGRLALQDGQPDRAEGWLREAVARDPGARDAHHYLVQCLNALGKSAEADEEQKRLDAVIKDLKEIQEIVAFKMQQKPYDPALRTRAGEIALRAGAEEEGVRWLEGALEIDPHYAPAHAALAAYYQAIGDRGRAAQHLEEAGGRKQDEPRP